jgi:hypothetical protein
LKKKLKGEKRKMACGSVTVDKIRSDDHLIYLVISSTIPHAHARLASGKPFNSPVNIGQRDLARSHLYPYFLPFSGSHSFALSAKVRVSTFKNEPSSDSVMFRRTTTPRICAGKQGSQCSF